MNILQRTLIEKTRHENGFENILPSIDGSVLLGSARHRAQATITLDKERLFLEVHSPVAKHLYTELIRSFPATPQQDERFILVNIDDLAALLRRAAKLAHSLPSQVSINFEEKVSEELTKFSAEGIRKTEIERMVRQRVGQNAYRNAMLDYWGGACAVTGIDVPEVLRASHAKPWADCLNDAERLDVYNGFLLNANLDAVFDRYLITFDTNGKVVIGSRLSQTQCHSLGLLPDLKLRWLADEHYLYLEYHRELFNITDKIDKQIVDF